MSQPPNPHAFPATKLGAFLRAMEDPEGTGKIEPRRERDIDTIEQRLRDPNPSSPDVTPDQA